jgi:hypothetical protein
MNYKTKKVLKTPWFCNFAAYDQQFFRNKQNTIFASL